MSRIRGLLLFGACSMVLLSASSASLLTFSASASDNEAGLGTGFASEPDPTLTSAFEKAYGLTEAEAQQRVTLQKEAAELNRTLQDQLGSRYAGMWFDNNDGRIKVGVVNSADDGTANAAIANDGLQADTDLVPVRSTWNELVATQETVNANLKDLLRNDKVQTGINTETNAVVIRVAPTASTAERERAVSLTSELSGVSIEVRYPPANQFEIASTACTTSPAGYNAKCDRPIRGATIIYHGSEECSAGFLMRREEGGTTHTWLMTAGHCLALDGGSNQRWYMENSKGESHEIGLSGGYVYGENYPNPGGTRDSGAIAISPSSFWASGMLPESYAYTFSANYYTEGVNEGYLGLGLCHLGISSANNGSGSNCGNIQTLHVSVRYSEGNLLNDMTEVTACSHPGDSGGPYYADNTAYGQQSGAQECPVNGGFNSGISFFDEAIDIEYEMGLDIWVY
jgi:streptogrisin C